MLTRRLPLPTRGNPHAKQGGVVLMIALIVLVAMTLAAIAMVRSVDTTNVIAGNLAFQQATTHSGDAGTEAAVAWLEANAGGTLWVSNIPNAYSATAVNQSPAAGQSWDNFWTTTIDPNPLTPPVANLTCSAAGQACTLPTDAAGNTVTYSITRLCNAQGDPTTAATGCAASVVTSVNPGASSQGSGEIGLQYSSQIYYRITSRIVGPRNTVSYVQSIIAM